MWLADRPSKGDSNSSTKRPPQRLTPLPNSARELLLLSNIDSKRSGKTKGKVCYTPYSSK